MRLFGRKKKEDPKKEGKKYPKARGKCPMCGSTEVRELTESERLFKKALGSMRGG